ncbi:MAG: mandelate racemase/muconate lactonizing enzyme family protein [Thermoproteota archaeon]
MEGKRKEFFCPSLNVVDVVLHRFNVFMRGFNYSFGTKSNEYVYLVKLKISDGLKSIYGYGEALSRDWYLEKSIARMLVGKNVLKVDKILSRLISGEIPLSSIEGFSIALHDCIAKYYNLPFYELFSGMKRNSCKASCVVHVSKKEVMINKAVKWFRKGFKHIKIKLSGKFTHDISVLKEIRSHIGKEYEIQVDANQGYNNLEAVLRLCKELLNLGICLLEDPMPLSKDCYEALKLKFPEIKLVADAFSLPMSFQEIVKLNVFSVVNHHPNRRGHLPILLQMDKAIQCKGLSSHIGSSGILGIQDVAYQHLAFALSTVTLCEDISLRPYVLNFKDYFVSVPFDSIKLPFKISDGSLVFGTQKIDGLGIVVKEEDLLSNSVDLYHSRT